MASNIRVVLEIDSKKYIADLKSADSATKSFASGATTASNSVNSSLTKMGNSSDTVTKRILGLRSAIAGLGFAQAVISANRYADSISDIADTTNLTISQVLAFSNAVAQSGGTTQGAQDALLKFGQTIGDAADGSKSAQEAFKAVNVTLTDLRKLSEEDLLAKTIAGIGKMEDASKRIKAQVDLFGKSAKAISFPSLQEKVAVAPTVSPYESAIKAGADAQQSLETNFNNLTNALLKVLEPLNKLAGAITISSQEFEKLIKIVLYAGGAYLLFTKGLAGVTGVMNTVMASLHKGGGALAWLTKQFRYAGTNAALIFVNMEKLVTRTMIGIGAAFGFVNTSAQASLTIFGSLSAIIANVARVLVRMGTAIGIIMAVAEAFEFLEKKIFGTNYVAQGLDIVAQGLEKIALIAGKLLNLPFDLLGKIFFGGKEGGSIGNPLIAIAEKAEQARKVANAISEQERTREERERLGAMNMAGYKTRAGIRANKETPDKRVIKPAIDLSIQLKQLQAISEEYRKQQQLVVGKLDTETRMVGMADEQKQLLQEQTNLALAFQSVQEALIKRRETLKDDEKGLAVAINAELAKNVAQYGQQQAAIVQSVTALQTANLLEKDRLANIERVTEAYEKQQQIQEAIGNFQRSLITAQKDVEFAGAQQKRSPFERQVADIKEQSKKAAQEAATAFSAAFDDGGDGMGAETAKQFADGLAKIYDGYKKIEEQQVAQLNYSKTWSAGWEEAFNAYKENSVESADTAQQAFATFTSGIEDAFVKFVQTGKLSFKDLINSMIADFAKLQAKKAITSLMDMGGGASGGMGSLFGGLGKLFGGFFADGGNPAMGKASIVGERGAELLIPRNASTVVPLEGLGGGGSTNVTYNINANDAQSFKQMLAREPEFLFAVTESGRRNMPTRSRR